MRANKEYDELNGKYLDSSHLFKESDEDNSHNKGYKRIVNGLLLLYLDDLKHDRVPSEADNLRSCLDFVSKFSTWEELFPKVKVSGNTNRPVALQLSSENLIIEFE